MSPPFRGQFGECALAPVSPSFWGDISPGVPQGLLGGDRFTMVGIGKPLKGSPKFGRLALWCKPLSKFPGNKAIVGAPHRGRD